MTADAGLAALMEELRAYPLPRGTPGRTSVAEGGEVCVPLVLETPHGMLSFLSTTTVFGTPIDVTLAEIAVEAFFPADAETADTLRAVAAGT